MLLLSESQSYVGFSSLAVVKQPPIEINLQPAANSNHVSAMSAGEIVLQLGNLAAIGQFGPLAPETGRKWLRFRCGKKVSSRVPEPHNLFLEDS